MDYLGLDFILEKSGGWTLIESNEAPVGLDLADRLSREANGAAWFRPAVPRLAHNLLARAAGSLAILLPDSLRISSALGLRSIDLQGLRDNRRLLAEDLNALGRQVSRLGGEARIFNAWHLRFCDGIFRDRQGRGFHFAFRRCGARHGLGGLGTYANDYRTQRICRDKLATLRIVGDAAGVPITTCDTANREQSLRFLQELASRDRRVILKPVDGFGGYGIRRLEPGEEVGAIPSGHLLQEWIEPAVTIQEGRPYHFDVRVFAFRGRILTALARVAAAPCNGLFRCNPLAWLTPLGSILPVTRTLQPQSVLLTGPQIQGLRAVTARVYRRLVTAQQRADEGEAIASLRLYRHRYRPAVVRLREAVPSSTRLAGRHA